MKNKESIKKVAFIVAFLFSITIPCIGNRYFSQHFDQENRENRTLSEFPVFSFSSVSQYPASLETYFNDHLPLKNELVRLYNRMLVLFFHSSNNSRVAVGKKGWLFYKDITDGDPISHYRGLNLLSEYELEEIANNMTATQNALESEGIDFIVFIAPNKERVYSENMPDYYGTPAKVYPVLQIVEYLKDNTNIKVVYPYQEIMEEKERLEDKLELYYKTDTHWNSLGAYIGTRELLNNLGISLPTIDDTGITIEKIRNDPGDLSNMLNIGELLDPGYDYRVSGYDTHNMEDHSGDDYSFTSINSDDRTVLMARDSFATALRTYIGSQFKRSDFIHWDHFTYESISKYSPDIFVLESVERYAPERLKTFCYTGGTMDR